MYRKIKYMLLVCTIAVVLFSAGCAKEGHVADKVSVMGVDISSMSREEAIKELSGVVIGEKTALINAGGEKIALSAQGVGAACNAEKTVDEIIEKSKGIFSGWVKKDYGMVIDIDMDMLDSALEPYETEGAAKSAQIVEEGIEITNAYPSKKLDRKKLTEALKHCFGNEESEEIALDFVTGEVNGSSDRELLAMLEAEYKEPEYIMDENGNITVTESKAGIVIDADAVLNIMGEHTGEGEKFIVPCEVKMPEQTKEELEEALFRDTLGSYKTNFSSSSANRASNINLCTGSINEKILMPGEVFSFNDSVGQRTVARGYKMAGAYIAGETVDQVGGGICQVSSTLYNSVLLSNLEIVERRSHQMTVSYVPMGRDATVNWGTTDFRFKNNTEYPIKIVGTINGRNVTISIVGTETIENKKVEILTNVVSTLEPVVETVEDPNKEVGFTETTQKGSKGYVVEATKVVYSNGEVVLREGLTKSRYNPKKTIMTVGTMPVEEQMPPGLLPPGYEVPVFQEEATVPAM